MVSPVLNEILQTAAFLISEAPHTLSRDFGAFDNSAGTLDLLVVAGTVYSIEAIGAATAAPVAGIHGNGTFGTITPNPQTAQVGAGNYQIIFTGATTFNVIGPDGRELAPGTTGSAYTDQLGFTLTAGGTAFQAGDTFNIAIAPGSQLLAAYTGAAPAAGIVFNTAYVPAGGSLGVTVITRNAEVNLGALIWGSGVNAGQQSAAIAQLRALGIVARA